MKPNLLKKYEQMIYSGMCSYILRSINGTDGSCWISDNVYIWAKESVHELMVTIKPNDSLDMNHNYTIDIEHNKIRIRRADWSLSLDIPHISTEEEYFQLSTIQDITIFPLDIYIKFSKLFDKVAKQCCGDYK